MATDAILEKTGFDRAVQRGGVGKALATSRYDASDLVATIVYYAVILITLQIAFSAFGPNPISTLLTQIVAFLPQLAVAIIIVGIAAAIAAAVKDLIGSAMGGLSYGRVLANVASVFIIGLGIIAALSQIGVAIAVTLPVLITVLATVAGILIVGVGGGLISPIRQRWEYVLSKAEQEAPRARAEAQTNSGQATADLRTEADPNQPDPGLPSTPTEEMPPVAGGRRGAHAPDTGRYR